MAVYSGPNIVTDGMILHLDKYNEQSYQGEPTVNLLPNPLISTTTGSLLSGWSFQNTGSYHTIKAGQPDPFGGNDAVLWEWPGHSTAYYPGINYTLSGLANTNTHTVSGWLKLAYGAPTAMQIILFRVSPWGYQVASPNLVGNGLTNEWVHFAASGTPQDTSQSQFRVINHVGGATPAFGMYIYGVQIEEKAHASKFVDGTRSATNGWRDLSGNDNHADLTSLTYSATNVPNTNVNDFSFNGVDDHIVLPYDSNLNNQNFSVCQWLYSTDFAQQAILWQRGTTGGYNQSVDTMIFTNPPTYDKLFAFRIITDDSNSGSNGWMNFYIYSGGNYSVNDNLLIDSKWNYLVCTYNSAADLAEIYHNGMLLAQRTHGGTIYMPSTSAGIAYISRPGSYAFDGKIASTQVYSKALSAAEVLQNYNAHKGRYGL